MKKIMCILLAGLLAVTLMAGCGGKKTGADGKVDLLLGLPGGDGITDFRVVDNFVAATKDKYNIEIDQSGWSDFTKKVKLQLVAKNDITPVFFTDSAQVMSFGEQGALADLDGYVKETLDETKYNKSLRAITNQEGKLWGVPHALNSIGILYNKDIFAEKGVALPTDEWTWQDMLDAAEKLTFDRDGDGKTDVYGIHYISNITQGWLPFMYAHGVSPLSEDFKKSNLDDPRIIEAMNAFMEPVNRGLLMEGAEISALGGIETAFAEGKIAMYISQFSSAKPINKFNPDLNYDAAIMPIGWNGERTCIYVPNAWVIADAVEEPVKKAAWDWISYYLSEEAQLLQAETVVSGFPIMKSALDKVSESTSKPLGKDAFYKGIDEFGATILENPCSTDVNGVINNMTVEIRTKEKTVEAAVADAHKDLQQTLDYFYEQAN